MKKLTILLTALYLIVGLSAATPGTALAINVTVTVNVDWDVGPSFDIAPFVVFCDANGVPLTNPMAIANFEQWGSWRQLYQGVPNGAVNVKVTWLAGDPATYCWSVTQPAMGPIGQQAALVDLECIAP